jgi:lipoate-protein ligase A
MDTCQLIVDGPSRGSWNMAVDEALLEAASESGVATLRFYTWKSPTLSLGYFQIAEQRHTHEESRPCDLLRRSSGGGAIVHDHELTYSLCLPDERLPGRPARLYDLLNEALIECLGSEGIAARMVAETKTIDKQEGDAFLCFSRRAATDVLVNEVKICGSAQRRRRGGVLQHGSILLRQSSCAPQLPGIEDLIGRSVNLEKLRLDLATGITSRLKLPQQSLALSGPLQRRAGEIECEKYGSAKWTRRR